MSPSFLTVATLAIDECPFVLLSLPHALGISQALDHDYGACSGVNSESTFT